MILHNTEERNPPEKGLVLESIIGWLMSEIARGASLIRQRSMILSIIDARPSLSRRRERLERDTAAYLMLLHDLAVDHDLDPLRNLTRDECRLIREATAPARREEDLS